MWIQKKLHELQQKPYAVRLRALKIIVAIMAILLLVIWGLTIRFRSQQKDNGLSRFAPILENFKQFKSIKFK